MMGVPGSGSKSSMIDQGFAWERGERTETMGEMERKKWFPAGDDACS